MFMSSLNSVSAHQTIVERPRDIHKIYTSRRWSNSEGGAGDLIYNSISARRDVIGRSWARPNNMSSLFDGPLSQEMSSRGGLGGGRGGGSNMQFTGNPEQRSWVSRERDGAIHFK